MCKIFKLVGKHEARCRTCAEVGHVHAEMLALKQSHDRRVRSLRQELERIKSQYEDKFQEHKATLGVLPGSSGRPSSAARQASASSGGIPQPPIRASSSTVSSMKTLPQATARIRYALRWDGTIVALAVM